MSWSERAASSLLPLSLAKHLRAALAEWRYTGSFFDLEEPQEVCQLCGQEDLRYQFEIYNPLTKHALLIGSECIKRFEISGIDDEGRSLSAEDTARLVDRHRRHLVEDARTRRVMTSLLKLSSKASDFDALSFISYVDDRGAFTPKQLALIFWQMGRHGITYRPRDYKLTIRRNREKAQLRELSGPAFQRVLPAMTPSQLAWMRKIEGRFASYGQTWRGAS